jgi:hypothetical protein
MTLTQTLARNARDPQKLGAAASLLGASASAGIAAGSITVGVAAYVIGAVVGLAVAVVVETRQGRSA